MVQTTFVPRSYKLQVDDGYEGILYLNAGSNIIKNEFEKKDCQRNGLGNIYKVKNRKNQESISFNITATLSDYVVVFRSFPISKLTELCFI